MLPGAPRETLTNWLKPTSASDRLRRAHHAEWPLWAKGSPPRDVALSERDSLVQNVEELFDLSKRCLMLLADIDHPIAVALQRARLGFSKSSGQECRGYCFASDIKPYDSS